jgi:hypothetical protein
MCENCYIKLIDKSKCPMCRQENPTFIKKVCNIGLLMDNESEDDQYDNESDDDVDLNPYVIFVRERLILLLMQSDYQN